MIWLSKDNIICSLGNTTAGVINKIEHSETGIKPSPVYKSITNAPLSQIDFGLFGQEIKHTFQNQQFTNFESLVAYSLLQTLKDDTIEPSNPRTLFILSTTKGNVEQLEPGKAIPEEAFLQYSAKKIAKLFGFKNSPLVVCNACISGVLAIITAMRYLRSGMYDDVVITGADIITEFVVAGFESFKSMSDTPCSPFDKDRTGLSLGEGAGTIILTNKKSDNSIAVIDGASANDANHISGPSRTGEGLFLAGKRALKKLNDIDYISAHGTATPYNDDMESQAINRLNLNHVPTNSYKGYFGHTLGAAGVIETILTKHSMQNNRLYRTLGLQEKGTIQNINVIKSTYDKTVNRALKLASGFGGCNAALVLEKK